MEKLGWVYYHRAFGFVFIVWLDALTEKIRQLREYQQSVRADLDRLEQSILHRAFSGK